MLALFWACSSDDGDDAGPTAGKGGSGAAGKAGTAGQGGTGGSGDSAGGRAGGTGEPGGSGGEAGTPEAAGASGSGAHGAGEAGSGGEAAGGGPAGASGEAGAGGEAGSKGGTSGAACLACASECEDELERCESSPLCNGWLSCVRACEGSSCVADCDDTYGAAPILLDKIYACLCASDCEAECSGVEVCDKSCEDDAGLPVLSNTPPEKLSDTGLYVEAAGAEPWAIAPYVRTFEPEYELWADGAVKQRYIYLPRCKPIHSSDMDHWSFPVGTRIWKQFTRDGVRIETRLLARFGTGVADWLMVSYRWPVPVSAGAPLDPETAGLSPEAGLDGANGTEHRIPSRGECTQCHGALSERVLGFSAIQLSYPASAGMAGDLTFSELADKGVLSYAPVRTGYDPPGSEVAQAALGYLHANCGNCHNETGTYTQSPSLWLRLLVGQTTVESTHVYTSAVAQNTGNPNFSTYQRIAPHHAELSSTILRMQRNPSLGEILPMPPIGRRLPDTAGVSVVSAWINSLPE
jgi:hypothetical protein